MTPKTSTPGAATSVSALAGDLRLACMRISRRVRFESTGALPPHQFSVLVRLDNVPSTPRELADIEKVSAPSMSRTVGSLVARGLVARQADPMDGRQVILSLTAEGRAVLHDIRRRRDEWMAIRLRSLLPGERAILVEATAILSRVAAQ